MERNVVQVELFHFGNYPRLKTVVRIFDKTGQLTRLTLTSVRLESKTSQLLAKYKFASPLGKWFLALRLDILNKKIYRLGYHSNCIAIEQILKALDVSPGEVAVENRNNTFRLCKKSEIEDLKGATRNSNGVWLFVFRSDQLLLDKYEPVAYMM